MTLTPCAGHDLDTCTTCRRLIEPGDTRPHTVRLQPMIRGEACADHVARPPVQPARTD